MTTNRRRLIIIALLAAAVLAFFGLDMIRRTLGLSRTPQPAEPLAWIYTDNQVEVNLKRTPELSVPGTAVRLEGKWLPKPVLLVYGDDGKYHAFHNKCTHEGRHIDHLAGQSKVQCCSICKSEWDYQGALLSGAAKRPLEAFPVEVLGNKIVITVTDG